MGYDPLVLSRATRRLEQERTRREARTADLRTRLFAQCPELSDLDRQLRGTILDLIAASLRTGTDPTQIGRAHV